MDKREEIAVGGRYVDCSLNDMKRRAKFYIDREQRKINPDTALIAVLCDTVRLAREYGDETCNMIRKYLSIRVKCPACNTGWKKPLLCDCKDGWIYPVFLTPDEARIIRELVHSEGGKNWKKIRDGLISKVKQAIKGNDA